MNGRVFTRSRCTLGFAGRDGLHCGAVIAARLRSRTHHPPGVRVASCPIRIETEIITP